MKRCFTEIALTTMIDLNKVIAVSANFKKKRLEFLTNSGIFYSDCCKRTVLYLEFNALVDKLKKITPKSDLEDSIPARIVKEYYRKNLK